MDAHAILITRVGTLAKRKALSINRLADAAGISRGYLSGVLRGVHSPSVQTVEKLAMALEVEVWQLFKHADPPQDGARPPLGALPRSSRSGQS